MGIIFGKKKAGSIGAAFAQKSRARHNFRRSLSHFPLAFHLLLLFAGYFRVLFTRIFSWLYLLIHAPQPTTKQRINWYLHAALSPTFLTAFILHSNYFYLLWRLRGIGLIVLINKDQSLTILLLEIYIFHSKCKGLYK